MLLIYMFESIELADALVLFVAAKLSTEAFFPDLNLMVFRLPTLFSSKQCAYTLACFSHISTAHNWVTSGHCPLWVRFNHLIDGTTQHWEYSSHPVSFLRLGTISELAVPYLPPYRMGLQPNFPQALDVP
jgi:hypothetical protein